MNLCIAILSALLQVVAAYALTDLLTGIYHFATDKGWNIRQQVMLFQRHHATNAMDADFDWQPMVIALPGMLLGAWLESPFVLALASFSMMSQVPHWYAHHRSANPTIRAVVRWLQKSGIIISPQEHASHHREPFDKNFCIFNGWNNWWTNRLIRAFDSDYGPGAIVFPVWTVLGGLLFLVIAIIAVASVVGVVIYSALVR